MPPKAAKKGVPEPTPDTPYTRKPLPPPDPSSLVASPAPPPPLPTLPPVSLETSLPDWADKDLVEERWDNGDGTTFLDITFETDQLPTHIKSTVKEWVRPFDVLNPLALSSSEEGMGQTMKKKVGAVPGGADTKRAGPGKKGKEAEAVVWTERDVDDSGKTLPKVVIPGETDVVMPGGRPLARPLLRTWTSAQRELIDRAAAAGPDAALPFQPPTVPDGPEADPVFAGVIKAVEALAQSLAPDGTPYLWGNIFPQTPEGRPVYNPGGKYLVRLWAAGKWRKIVIDDRLPVTQRKDYALVSSVDPLELWPSLLSKAVYKLYHMTGARALHPDLYASNDVLAGFVAYAVHAMTGAVPGGLPASVAHDDMLQQLKEGGTPVEDIDRMKMDQTPWLTIEANKPGRKKVYWKRKKKSQRKKLRIFFDEVDVSVTDQSKRLATMETILTAPRNRVFLACYVEETVEEVATATSTAAEPSSPAEPLASSSPQPQGAEGDRPPASSTVRGGEIDSASTPTNRVPVTVRRPVIKPMLAVATSHRQSAYRLLQQQAAAQGTSEPLAPYPRVLTGFSSRPPKATVPRDEAGMPLHKRVKGEPSVYWNAIEEGWQPTSVLMSQHPSLLLFHSPAPVPYQAHRQWHWPLGGKDTTTTVPPPLHPPTYLYVEAKQQPADLVMAVLKAQPSPGPEGLPPTDVDPWVGEIKAYLQEIRLPSDPTAPAVVEGDGGTAAAGNQDPAAADGGQRMPGEEAEGGGGNPPGETEEGQAPPERLEVREVKKKQPSSDGPSPVCLLLRLSLTGPTSFTSSLLTIPPSSEGRLYRLVLHSPLGASVFFSSNTKIQVGDAASVWKAATATKGCVVEEQGTYNAVPAGQHRLLFRRVIKVEPFSGPGNTMLHLSLTDPSASAGVRLVTINNDTGEAVTHALLHTGYSTWAPNSLGYTILAAYHSATADLAPGPWRLSLFSDARVATPLSKQEVGVVTRYAGSYTPNKYHRLFKDILQTTAYPVSLRLSVNRPDTYLRLRVTEDKSGTLVADVRGRRSLTLHSLGLDGLPGPESSKRYNMEASLDEEMMMVTMPNLDSPRPYYFVQTGTGGSGSFDWSLEVTSEAAVSLAHDTSDLDRFAKVRQGWEAAQAGRAERAKKVRDMFVKASREGTVFTAAQRVEVLSTLLDPSYEGSRQERRQQEKMVPATVREEGEGEGAAVLFEAEDLAIRLSKQKEVVGSTTMRLQQQAADRKAALDQMQDEFKAKVAEMEARRQELVAVKDAIWAKREAIRAEQVTRAAEEARKAAEEEAAAAALLAPDKKKKK